MNQKNTDTIIIASIDTEKNKATLISIPRDLYYKNSKINSIYPRYGAYVLRNSISELTGLKIDKYVLVEMYAFADLINILGGIDVELTESLVDPTYKVRDANGRWSTLCYPAGVHHVNGVEALRIARARHFTPVFSRDLRQQQILGAVKNRLMSIGAMDVGKLVKIIRLGLKYVETDVSWLEAFNLYRGCHDISLKNVVVNTSNVLYATYTDYGAWIVMPLDNDFEVIKKFIEEKISE